LFSVITNRKVSVSRSDRRLALFFSITDKTLESNTPIIERSAAVINAPKKLIL